MGRWSKWIGDATRPLPDELARLQGEARPEWAEVAREATAPTDDEVQRLLRRRVNALPVAEPGVSWGAWAAAGLAVAAMATAAVVSWPQAEQAVVDVPYGELAVAMHTPLALTPDQVVALGPSIDARVDGSLRVDQAGAEGTWVALLDGTASFEVDPNGAHRKLVVRADDVEVEVKGTVFDVTVDGDTVAVGVTRGRVAVRHNGEERFLGAGERWVRPVSAASAVLAPASGVVAGVEAAVVAGVSSAPAGVSAPPVAVMPSALVQAPPAVVDAAPVAVHAPVHAPVDGAPVAVDGGSPMHTERTFARLKRAFERGERSLELLGDLTTELERLPAGSAQRDEVAAMRWLVLARHRADRDTASALLDFAEAHPSSVWYEDLLAEHARISHRALNDCGTALRSYERLDALQAGAEQARTRVGLGLCLAATGDRKGAAHALSAALAYGVDPVALRAEATAACAELRGCTLPK